MQPVSVIIYHACLQAALAAIAALGSLSAISINENITVCPKAMLEESASRALDQLLPSLVFANKVKVTPKSHSKISSLSDRGFLTGLKEICTVFGFNNMTLQRDFELSDDYLQILMNAFKYINNKLHYVPACSLPFCHVKEDIDHSLCHF